MENKDKVVLITGASSGIGACTARHLASLGYGQLCLVARRLDKLAKVAEDCLEKGAKDVHTIEADLNHLEECDGIIQKTVDKFGGLDIFISNAGTWDTPAEVRNMDLAGLQRMTNVNYLASYMLTKHALPYLEKSKGGRILYIGSIAGETTMKQLSAYAASKAALIHFAKIVAREEASKGIRVNVLSPGFIMTEVMSPPNASMDETRDWFKSMQPLGRAGEEDEMAKMIAFLVSENNNFMVGSNVVCDGGAMLDHKEFS